MGQATENNNGKDKYCFFVYSLCVYTSFQRRPGRRDCKKSLRARKTPLGACIRIHISYTSSPPFSSRKHLSGLALVNLSHTPPAFHDMHHSQAQLYRRERYYCCYYCCSNHGNFRAKMNGGLRAEHLRAHRACLPFRLQKATDGCAPVPYSGSKRCHRLSLVRWGALSGKYYSIKYMSIR